MTTERPTTEAGRRHLVSIAEIFEGEWGAGATGEEAIAENPELVADILAIEAEAAAGARAAQDDLLEQLVEIAEDRTATDPDDDWHRGFHEAARRLRDILVAAPAEDGHQ